MELESSLSTAASTEATPRFQVVIQQSDLSALLADLTTARSFADSTTSALNTLRTDNERLESRVAELLSTVDEIRFQLATAQSYISFAAF